MKKTAVLIIAFLLVAPLALAKETFYSALESGVTAAGHPMEGKLESFMGEPKFDTQPLYKGGRFPNMLVAVDGTLLALWDGVKVRRSEDGGETWEPKIMVGKGHMGGGAIVNETNGEVLVFVEDFVPPAPLTVYRSKDHGKSWEPMEVVIEPDTNGNAPSMHMNEAGITLRHGKHAGRIIRAARHYGKRNHPKYWPTYYTTAIYSDDDGKTWKTSKPFAEMGTGEAAIAELLDGRLYYNSRSHWNETKPPKKRRSAWSADGGETWTDWQIVEILPDGPQHETYGCMGGLVRLPIQGKDILIYTNCDSPRDRELGTAWVSFDGGKTWPLKRLVHEGDFGYSSLSAGRPATKSEGWIYLNFEGGPKGGRVPTVARFNLSWLLKGEKTGDGELPKWIGQTIREEVIVPPGSKGDVSVVLEEGLEEVEAGEIGTPAIVGMDGAEMVLIPAGEFQMGTDASEIPGLVKSYNVKTSWFEDETPRHTVYLDAFYMDKYEVTNALYKKFMDATGHRPSGYWKDSRYNAPDRPVVGVSWDDAVAYAEWAGKRLPTEAEWEKAARGGLVGKKYPWGDKLTHDNANYMGTGDRDTWNGPSPIGSFSPNDYGLYDMAGNVWEWCADWYDSYPNSRQTNPAGPSSGDGRVLRGGSWFSNNVFYAGSFLRCAARLNGRPQIRSNSLAGFRCAE